MSFLTSPLLWVNRDDRTRVVLTGSDRVRFLHNLTTQDIKQIRPGHGAESFVTNLQGKTLGYVSILVGDDDILLRSAPGGFEHILPLFAKYGIFDDVQWSDLSASTSEVHLFGPEISDRITEFFDVLPGAEDGTHLLIGDGVFRGCRLIRESLFGSPGYTILGDRADFETKIAPLYLSGPFHHLSASESEGLRIEAGLPEFGRDVLPENLPQELGRTAQAISFRKGCYLGQETVARIDALGHVNKVLMGLIADRDVPPRPGISLSPIEGKNVGNVTSSAISPRTGRAVALVMTRTQFASAGTRVTWNDGDQAGSGVLTGVR